MTRKTRTQAVKDIKALLAAHTILDRGDTEEALNLSFRVVRAIRDRWGSRHREELACHKEAAGEILADDAAESSDFPGEPLP